MKTIEQYINEHIIKGHLKKQYKYHTKTKKELIEAIKTELDKGNTNLNCIDTSEITDMRLLFDQEDGIKLTDKQQKTLDISKWDLSNVTDVFCMFYKCQSFNCDLSNWDVSDVTNMTSMFAHCKNFNSDLSKWNVSKVTKFSGMFEYCKQFNCDLSNWKVITAADTYGMFNQSGLDEYEPDWYKK